MLNGNERRPFYRILFPGKDHEGGLTARVPDVNETRLNENFKIVSDEFRRIWDFIKNGLKTKSLTVDGDASIGGDASVGGQLSAGSAALGDTNVDGALDVDGSATFDSGVTVGGVLSVTNRRSAMLSNVAAGWHRVLEFAPTTATYRLGRAGIIIDLDITRFGTTNETHHVSLSLIETNAKFYGEFSNSDVHRIDKIRYTYDSSKGYVDIHLSSLAGSNVAVDYQVSASASSFRGQVKTLNLADVADTPSGETVLTEYTLSANGTGDLNVNGIVTGQGFADLLFGLGTSIPSNTDCNSLTSEGKYTCGTAAIAGTLTNSPYTDSAFGMLVIRVANSLRLVQVAMPNSGTITVKLRFYSGTNWGAWKALTPSTDIAKTEFTPTNATAYSSYGNCYYERQGRIVHVHIGVSGLTADAITIIASLPTAIIPSTKILAYGMGGSFLLGAMCRIETDGSVQVRSDGTYALADFVYMV